MNKKLTDSEIVKAFECCNVSGLCNECPVKKDFNVCNIIDKLAIDLINRQKEENNKYNKIKELLDMFWNVLLKIGMAKQNEECFTLEEFAEALQDIQDKAKSKAYKEFAERLDKEFSGVGTCNYGCVHHKTRKVLKELGGEDE
jgi:hypothetical protein